MVDEKAENMLIGCKLNDLNIQFTPTCSRNPEAVLKISAIQTAITLRLRIALTKRSK